jgi:hypothetical protein
MSARVYKACACLVAIALYRQIVGNCQLLDSHRFLGPCFLLPLVANARDRMKIEPSHSICKDRVCVEFAFIYTCLSNTPMLSKVLSSDHLAE